MSNKRVFYATQAVLLGDAGSTLGASDVLKGVQSIGVDTSIERRSIKDLGKPSPIATLEDRPFLGVNIERFIGSVSDVIFQSSGGNLLADAVHAKEYDMLLLVGEDGRDQIDTVLASTQSELKLSYMQISSVTYSFNVDGPVIETISFEGHNKEWSTTRTFSSTGELGFTHSGDVAKRSDYNTSSSIMPSEVQGTIQSIDLTINLSRRELGDLGKRQGVSAMSETNKYKLLDLPVTVASTITTIIKEKDFNSDLTAQSFTNAPASKQIKVVLTLGGSNLTFDLGSENYLTKVDRRGADTGGGNVEAMYDFENYNTFSMS